MFRGKIFSVTVDEVREPTGITARRDVVRHPGSVIVLALDQSQAAPRILLERQYRYTADEYLWELPSGSIDAGENSKAAAKRELLEETGYRAKKWTQALTFYPSPGFLTEKMTVYVAQELKAGEAQPESDEVLECHLLPLSQAVEMVMAGEIRAGNAIVPLLWLAEALRRGEVA